jgi:hypothetical protein
MATPTDITTGAQTVTTTGAVTPTTGLSVAALTGSYTLAIEVSALTAGVTARLQLEDTTNAFTAATALAVWDITGQVESGAQSIKKTWRSYELPDSKFNVSGGAYRLNVTALDGTSPSLTVHAWIEQ